MDLLYKIKYIPYALSILGAMIVLCLWFDIILQTGVALNSILGIAYIILFIIIFFVLVFTIINLIADKNALISTLKTLGAFLILFLICYFVLARGEDTPLRDGKMLSAAGSKLISAALFMFYSLILIASGSMLWFSIKNRK